MAATTVSDPAPPRTALELWRQGRYCNGVDCRQPIRRGPAIFCTDGHGFELRPDEVRWPLAPRSAELIERGYWLRWGSTAIAFLFVVIGIASVTLRRMGWVDDQGFTWIATVCMFPPAIVLGIMAARIPTRSQIDRELKAAEPLPPPG